MLLIVSRYVVLMVGPIAKPGALEPQIVPSASPLWLCKCKVVGSSSFVVACNVIMAIPAYRTRGVTLPRKHLLLRAHSHARKGFQRGRAIVVIVVAPPRIHPKTGST